MRQFDLESFPSVSMMVFLKDYVGEDEDRPGEGIHF